mgnify:CR=1 FL=1
MKKIILVRYGQYENGNLTEEGINTMTETAGRLKVSGLDKSSVVISSETPRAFQSAKVISEILESKFLVNNSFYAAEEDGVFVDNAKAAQFVNTFSSDVDNLIIVASREYIESFPAYFLETKENTRLERGECLVIDCENKSISYIK